MVSLNLADTFVTFLALLGPQKVLLSFAQLARTLDARSLRLVAMATAVTAAIVGTLCAITAPWLATFFHLGPGVLALASGIVFFVYAVGLVLGIHFDLAEAPAKAIPNDEDDGGVHAADRSHPVRSGFHTMLLPFVVSPLAVAADAAADTREHSRGAFPAARYPARGRRSSAFLQGLGVLGILHVNH